jgi:hypothetical protein
MPLDKQLKSDFDSEGFAHTRAGTDGKPLL